MGSAGGFYLALTIEPKYLAYAVGLFMLSTASVSTTAMAYAAIRRGEQQVHRELMMLLEPLLQWRRLRRAA